MKTAPFSHQKENFDLRKDVPNYALFWEQGVGKTKASIDIICHKYLHDVIDAVIVIAPKNVHPNWAYDELPTHMWDDIEYETLVWNSKKVKNKGFKRQFDHLISYDGLSIITMNYESILNRDTYDMVLKMLDSRSCMVICDESHRMKTPNAKVTKALLKLAPHAKSRWVLTGTSITKSPFDIYTQLKFVSDDIFPQKSYYAFKNRYGRFIKLKHPTVAGKLYDHLVDYRNLDELTSIINSHSSRVLKSDVLDLPEKIYQKRYIDMSDDIKRAYESMKNDLFVELGDVEVAAPLVISKLGKLQQIVCGFIIDEHGNTIEICRSRVNSMLEDLPEEKCIIWGKFKHDHVMIGEELTKRGVDYVTFTGSTSEADRETAKRRFREDPECRVFLGNPKACREGLTLTAAKYVLNYNRSFDYIDNSQSEDRVHRIGQDRNVVYIDYVAKGTIDEAIIENLRDKRSMADLINGDNFREWI